MTELKFNELAKQISKGFSPLQRIGLSILFLIAPGSTLVIFAKTFLQLAEECDDNQIKQLLEEIKNA